MSFLLNSDSDLNDLDKDNYSGVWPSKKARAATQMPVQSGSQSSQVARVSPIRNRKQQSICMSAPAPVQQETVTRSPTRRQAIHTVPSK
jgi:hypothetical protein